MSKKILLIVGIIILSGCAHDKNIVQDSLVQNMGTLDVRQELPVVEELDAPVAQVVMPMDRALERITKKPFGVLIDPATSPVQPERFRGYHKGTDFEAFDEELSQDVDVYTICAGKILSASTVNGYGGVITQACVIDEWEVRVVYGHVAIDDASIVNRLMTAGERITRLGNHESAETDEERKHLHLGIIKGAEINLRGYVQNENELTKWLNIEDLIKS